MKIFKDVDELMYFYTANSTDMTGPFVGLSYLG